MVEKNKRQPKVVERYFSYLEAIQEGDRDAVDGMLELWDEDGRFSFVGAPPITGEFRGRAALAALYRNLAGSKGLSVRTEEPKKPEAVLARRRTQITRQRLRDDKFVAQWSSRVDTEDGRFFTVAGTNTFQLHEGKITAIDVVISPRPGEAEGFAVTDLEQIDIGRLSLAAWAVV